MRDLWKGAYIVNGNYDHSRTMKGIADGRADFVSFGKLFLANRDLPLRFARSAPSTYRIGARSMAATSADIGTIPFWKSLSPPGSESFWRPAAARSTLRSVAIVQHHRPAVDFGEAELIQ